MTDEQRAKISAVRTGSLNPNWGHVVSPETRAKIGAGNRGKIESPESRAKNSTAHLGRILPRGPLSHNWRGGKRATWRRVDAENRLLGFIPLNAWFAGSDGHHVDREHIIYMPHKLHHSIYHCLRTGKGMAAINAIAYSFLTEQEIEIAIEELK